MKITKHLLLAIALIGMSGIYLPFVTVRSHGVPIKFTAKELSFGFERTHKALEYKIPGFVEKRIPADYLSDLGDARLVAHAMRWAMALYIPLCLLLLLGIGAEFAGYLGRGTGICVLLLGLITAGSWFALRYAIAYGIAELALKRTTAELAPGAHILIFVGIGGIVAGLLGTIRPEQRKKRSTPHAPPIATPPQGSV